MTYATLADVDVAGKRVLLRVDFNVPLESGRIVDGTRIRESLPTVRWLLRHGARQVILMSHLGRPKGREEKSSLRPVAAHLHGLLGEQVGFVDDCLSPVPSTRVVLLENLRFHPEEEKNERAFAEKLAAHADLYVNDAFGTAHRAHASVAAITEFLPSCAGLLMAKELKMLHAVAQGAKPLVVLLGGAKLETKLPVIERFLPFAERILVGGAMPYTFLAAEGGSVGSSLVEQDYFDRARELLHDRLFREKVLFPEDCIISPDATGNSPMKESPSKMIPEGWMGLDLGTKSTEAFLKELGRARTVLWNGPLGFAEVPAFAMATERIAFALAEGRAKVVAGGGDTLAVLERLGLTAKYAHCSTGGGAFLELISGKKLPALEALERG